MSNINSKELKVIDSISRNSDSSQRDIAKDVGLSLGLTNILINRLIKEGYLKVRHLNTRKVRYIITPRGLKEKAKKSYKFMRRSFSVINRLKEIIIEFALNEYKKGNKEFTVLGDGELSDITELVLSALNYEDLVILRKDNKEELTDNTVVFNTLRNGDVSYSKQINIWSEAEKLYGRNYEI